jgi:shikimate kinase
MDTPIFLVGYRAVGKTTIGEKLAARLACRFIDTDQMISQRKGASVRSIVDKEGWEGFRRVEKQILSELIHCGDCVVATGGGAIMHREQWREIRGNSLVVWLTAAADILIDRLGRDIHTAECRPSLTGRESTIEIYDLLKEREPLYRESAHLTVDTGKCAAEEIIDIILKAYTQITK